MRSLSYNQRIERVFQRLFDIAVKRALKSAVAGVDADDGIGCMVLTGSEKAFAAGADIQWMAEQRITTGYRRKGNMKAANTRNLQACITRGLDYILIDRDYEIDYSL